MKRLKKEKIKQLVGEYTLEGLGLSQKKEVFEKDKYFFYEFVGECYIHGMMHGEAAREKYYRAIPERIIELR